MQIRLEIEKALLLESLGIMWTHICSRLELKDAFLSVHFRRPLEKHANLRLAGATWHQRFRWRPLQIPHMRPTKDFHDFDVSTRFVLASTRLRSHPMFEVRRIGFASPSYVEKWFRCLRWWSWCWFLDVSSVYGVCARFETVRCDNRRYPNFRIYVASDKRSPENPKLVFVTHWSLVSAWLK